MGLTRLTDDLLVEYKEHRRLTNQQLDLFDPLAVAMRRPAAQRLLSKGVLIFFEVFCYLAFAGAIAVAILRTNIYPLLLVTEMRMPAGNTQGAYVPQDLQNLEWCLLGLVLLSGLLFFILARTARRIRIKNNLLFQASRNIKTLVGQLLQRKAAIDAIDQRHFQEFPEVQHTASVPRPVDAPPGA